MINIQSHFAFFWRLMDEVHQDARTRLDMNIGTEAMPMHLGNVSFWKADNAWCYNIPVERWDAKEVAADLAFWLDGKAR